MTREEIVKISIDEIEKYAKSKGVRIEHRDGEFRFYGYSKESAKEIQYMLMDSINKKLMDARISYRVKVED